MPSPWRGTTAKEAAADFVLALPDHDTIGTISNELSLNLGDGRGQAAAA
jgi:hypothetical protein